MKFDRSRGKERSFYECMKQHKEKDKKREKKKKETGWGIYDLIYDTKLIRPPCGFGSFFDPYEEEKQEEFEIKPLTKEQEQVKEKVMQLRDVLEEKFINVSEVAEILEIGFLTNKNVFLYGRGGHAKSEIIQEFLKYVDPDGGDSFVQACGEGLSEEKLFGGLNLQKFQKTGEIEYLVENSFMNKRYVVFEELLDSRLNVLLSLKDIITSGTFRQGSQQFKIRTEFIICLTNRTKQEVSEDNSIKALMERFPLEMKVEWGKYEANDYCKMFSKVLGNSFEEIGSICQSINERGDFISPRTAVHMAQVYQKTGDLSTLRYFGATGEVLERVERLKRERIQKEFLDKKEKEWSEIVKILPSNIDEIRARIKECKRLISEIGQNEYISEVFPRFAALKDLISRALEAHRNQIVKLIENE